MVGYCVAAHCRPSQTRRLILPLLADDPSCRVVLHYDQQQERLDLVELADPRITTVPQRYVPWGTFAMVELFMEMMRTAVEELTALTSCSSQGRTTPPQHPRPGTRACPLRRLGSGQSAGCRGGSRYVAGGAATLFVPVALRDQPESATQGFGPHCSKGTRGPVALDPPAASSAGAFAPA
jgi:hypothetical protein